MSHWERKMKTYFKRIDFDKDGSITRKDFEGMAERFIATPDFNKDHADDLKKTLTAVSRILQKNILKIIIIS